MRRMLSWSQKIEARTFPTDFCTWNFLGRGEPLFRHSIDCCLSLGHSDMNQVLSMVTNCDRKSFGSRWKSSTFPQTTDVFDLCSGILGPTLWRASACPNLHESWTQPAHERCSAIDMAKIRWSSKISSWIWSIISGVVTVLGCWGQGTSQVEKSPGLNWATQFLMVAYDGACSPNVSVRMVWISFGNLPCQKKK